MGAGGRPAPAPSRCTSTASRRPWKCWPLGKGWVHGRVATLLLLRRGGPLPGSAERLGGTFRSTLRGRNCPLARGWERNRPVWAGSRPGLAGWANSAEKRGHVTSRCCCRRRGRLPGSAERLGGTFRSTLHGRNCPLARGWERNRPVWAGFAARPSGLGQLRREAWTHDVPPRLVDDARGLPGSAERLGGTFRSTLRGRNCPLAGEGWERNEPHVSGQVHGQASRAGPTAPRSVDTMRPTAFGAQTCAATCLAVLPERAARPPAPRTGSPPRCPRRSPLAELGAATRRARASGRRPCRPRRPPAPAAAALVARQPPPPPLAGPAPTSVRLGDGHRLDRHLLLGRARRGARRRRWPQPHRCR